MANQFRKINDDPILYNSFIKHSQDKFVDEIRTLNKFLSGSEKFINYRNVKMTEDFSDSLSKLAQEFDLRLSAEGLRRFKNKKSAIIEGENTNGISGSDIKRIFPSSKYGAREAFCRWTAYEYFRRDIIEEIVERFKNFSTEDCCTLVIKNNPNTDDLGRFVTNDKTFSNRFLLAKNIALDKPIIKDLEIKQEIYEEITKRCPLVASSLANNIPRVLPSKDTFIKLLDILINYLNPRKYHKLDGFMKVDAIKFWDVLPKSSKDILFKILNVNDPAQVAAADVIDPYGNHITTLNLQFRYYRSSPFRLTEKTGQYESNTSLLDILLGGFGGLISSLILSQEYANFNKNVIEQYDKIIENMNFLSDKLEIVHDDDSWAIQILFNELSSDPIFFDTWLSKHFCNKNNYQPDSLNYESGRKELAYVFESLISIGYKYSLTP